MPSQKQQKYCMILSLEKYAWIFSEVEQEQGYRDRDQDAESGSGENIGGVVFVVCDPRQRDVDGQHESAKLERKNSNSSILGFW